MSEFQTPVPTAGLPVSDLPDQGIKSSNERGGCGLLALFILLTIGILSLTALTLVSQWVLEQAIFEGSFKFDDFRWAIQLGFSLALLITFVILFFAVTNPFYKRVYRTFLLASLYCLVLVPVHLAGITAAQLTNVLQIGMSALFLAGLFLWARLSGRIDAKFYRRPSGSAVALAIAAAAVSGYLWLAWGAFGSLPDTALNLLAGLSLGASLAMILKYGLFESAAESGDSYTGKDFWFYGFVASLAFGMAVTSFGHNGNEGILFVVVPWTGWLAAAYFGRNGSRAVIWPAMILIGMAAAWPLMLIDSDELSIVINSGAGELLEIAVKATLGTLLIGLAVLLLGLINPKRRFALPGGLAAIAILGAAAIYFLIGQAGFYGERLFVIMKTQTDLSGLRQVEPPRDRRDQVYRQMISDAEESQADLRSALESRNIRYTPYYLVNGMEVEGGPILKAWLEGRPDVDRVLDSPHLRPLPDEPAVSKGELTERGGGQWNLEMIQADQVWSELGIRGEGIVVGQSDSGVDGSHPEVLDSYRGRDGNNDYNWFDPWFGTETPADKNGHGTHTLGTILGNNVGVAPDAEWIGCVNLGRNLGNPAVYLECMQFMLAPFPQGGDPFTDGKPELGANVMNNSWGCPFVEGCDPGTYLQAVKALRAAGVFVVVSAGNTGLGGCGTVTDPLAIYDEVLSVGAVNSAGQRAEFSSLGPVTVDGSNRVKPDLMAPGDGVLSSFPENTYSVASGTSMAGPHVVGVVALMWSANPELIGDIDRTSEILASTAKRTMDTTISCESNTSYPNNETGYGIVNAFEAVKMALEEK